MTLKQLRFLIAASKREIATQWGNAGGVEYCNELLARLDAVTHQMPDDSVFIRLQKEPHDTKEKA